MLPGLLNVAASVAIGVMTPSPKQVVLGCLAGLAIALLLVGMVSGTVLRHVVQILPILVALGVVSRRPESGAFAALPLFLFWLLIVLLIWLYLLGLSRIASGHYTRIEVASTFLMMVCSVLGVIGCLRLGRGLRVAGRVLVFLLFAAMQIGAMRLSFLDSIVNR